MSGLLQFRNGGAWPVRRRGPSMRCDSAERTLDNARYPLTCGQSELILGTNQREVATE